MSSNVRKTGLILGSALALGLFATQPSLATCADVIGVCYASPWCTGAGSRPGGACPIATTPVVGMCIAAPIGTACCGCLTPPDPWMSFRRPPPPVTLLIEWSATGPVGTLYDLLRGDLAMLRPAGDFIVGTTVCEIDATPLLSYVFPGPIPAPDAAHWFLVRDDIGFTYENGASQVGLRDAEIVASGLDCP